MNNKNKSSIKLGIIGIEKVKMLLKRVSWLLLAASTIAHAPLVTTLMGRT